MNTKIIQAFAPQFISTQPLIEKPDLESLLPYFMWAVVIILAIAVISLIFFALKIMFGQADQATENATKFTWKLVGLVIAIVVLVIVLAVVAIVGSVFIW